jgi:2-polyprenyl-3-methyl-5-hydroxy-6-metoxy-1,4-benzoquinol methylase
MKTSNCEVCNNSEFSTVYQPWDYLMDNENINTTFVLCSNCGLIFQNPRMSQAEINEHYPPDYDSFQDVDIKSRDVSSRITQYGLSKRSRIIFDLLDSGRLLDVGCAAGNFLRTMQNSSRWDLFGVEISEHAASIARNKYGLNVFTGELNEANYPENYFDIITLWDVLEHIFDPKLLLLEVNRVLRETGYLILRVPNGGSWDARLFGKYWFGLDAPRHNYVFDKNTITQLLENSGFRVKKIDCSIGSSVAVPMNLRFYMTAKKYPENWRTVGNKVASHPITKLGLLPFTFFFDQMLLGSFLTVIAEKRS